MNRQPWFEGNPVGKYVDSLSRTYKHGRCNATKVSGDALVRLECPFRPLDGSICAGCGNAVRLDSVVWTDTNETVMAYRARVRGSVSGWECARLTLLSNAYEGALRLNLKPSGEARGPVRQDREFPPLKQMTPAMQWLSASIFLVPCLAFIIIMEVGSLSYDGYLPFMKEADSLAKYRKENPTVLTRKGPAPGAFDAKVPSGFSAVQYQSGDRKLLAWLSVPKAAGKHRAVLFAGHHFSDFQCRQQGRN